MKFFIFASALILSSSLVQALKKCEKIDACRCSTDEGEINIWSVAGQKTNGARFNISASGGAQKSTYYLWNPCGPRTDQGHPCQDSSVCQVTQINPSEVSRENIGEHDLSNCILDEKKGQCMLTYGVMGKSQVKTSISMVCSETEVGKVGPMSVAGSSYSTSLHSICACPGRCLLDAKEDAGIRFDSSNVGGSGLSVGAIMGIAIAGVIFLIVLLFAIFICCLRRKLPSGIPKPSVCTTVKVGLGMIKKKLCPCC
ncbi:uncharacterized protein LOC111333370 [Stylophora pistillata]|uniref:uncharacterized protein LOC111333370 n=1 Tax=Stylophora pistillata TaxID=50429 RepID=UPI000C04A703|nr:uncharacterized protein LOC111333370 [Stylophora pistillata]